MRTRTTTTKLLIMSRSNLAIYFLYGRKKTFFSLFILDQSTQRMEKSNCVCIHSLIVCNEIFIAQQRKKGKFVF